MTPRVWKYSSAFLLTLVLFQFYLILTNLSEKNALLVDRPSTQLTTPAQAPPPPPFHPNPNHDTSPDRPGSWTFDHLTDADNVGLSLSQCSTAFPALYQEIDRAVSLWRDDLQHSITPADTDISWRGDAAFKILIYDNQLRVLETKNTYQGYRDRTLAVMHQIHRALLGASAAGEKVPNAEIAVQVDDLPMIDVARGEPNDTTTILGFTRNRHKHAHDRIWLTPDFSFWAQPPASASWPAMHAQQRTHDGYLSEKIPQAVWRGARWTNEPIRGALISQTHDKPWADVRGIDWESDAKDKQAEIMAMEDFCKYWFVLHTEGRSWSARLKFLLLCDSVPVVHELDWTVWYSHLLRSDGPDRNHVAVQRDFADLEEKVERLLKKEAEAQAIADASKRTFRERYLTLAAEACYWRRLLWGWAEVAVAPEPWEVVEDSAAQGGRVIKAGRRLRGITFEEWTSVKGNYPDDYEFNMT